MKLPSRTQLLALLALSCSGAFAQITPVGTGAFSASATLIDFSLPASNETQITNQYAADGIVFSGALYTMQNLGDLAIFPTPNGQIASNWRYNGPGLSGRTIDLWFTSAATKVGAYVNYWSNDTVVWDFYSGANLVGSVAQLGQYPSSFAVFAGFESVQAFDHVQLTISGPDNNFFAMDDLRFEAGALTAVPEPSTYGLLGAAALAAAVAIRRRRKTA